MFGQKKMYKKGLADALHANEEFSKKQEDALNHIREEVRSGNKELKEALDSLGDEIVGIYDHLDAKEKEALYHLSTPYDIKKLEDAEQQLLLAVLFQLANSGSVNDLQQTYIQGITRYLGIKNPQTHLDDLSVVGDVDSGVAQKAILQTVLEFFYLQDSDELTDEQEEFLENFSVNKKQAQAIEVVVSRFYNATGAKGLAEKYGRDGAIQQANDQALEAFASFEEKVDSKDLYVSAPLYSHYCWVKTVWAETRRSANFENECYESKSKCESDAERYLEKYHRAIEKVMDSKMKKYGDQSLFDGLTKDVERRLKWLRNSLPNMRSSRTASVLDEIGKCLSKTKVMDELGRKHEYLRTKHSLPSVGNYTSEIEYEVHDPSEWEEGFLMKAFARNFKKYGYNIDSAIDSIKEDAEECVKEYIEELTDCCNDLIDSCVIDPIQELLPTLYDALSTTDDD